MQAMKFAKTFLNCTIQGRSLQFEISPPEFAYLDSFQSVGGNSIWPASDIIINYLCFHKDEMVKDHRILELGSGCGYVGIVCGVLGASHVTLTDRLINSSKQIYNCEGVMVDEQFRPSNALLNLIRRNMDINRSHCFPSFTFSVQELEWGSQYKYQLDKVLFDDINSGITNESNFDLLLGSDLTYNCDISASLFWTIKEILKVHNNSSKFLLAHEDRLRSSTQKTIEHAKNSGLNHSVIDKHKQFELWELQLI
jgi:predicted nicotinamide N-methyase